MPKENEIWRERTGGFVRILHAGTHLVDFHYMDVNPHLSGTCGWFALDEPRNPHKETATLKMFQECFRPAQQLGEQYS